MNQVSLRSTLAILVNQLLAPSGLTIRRREKDRRKTEDLITGVFDALSHRPFVVDVGAGSGKFSAAVLDIVPDARLVCIEPIEGMPGLIEERLAGSDFEVINCAAGAEEGKATLFQMNFKPASSLLPLDRHREELPLVSQEELRYEVQVKTLDNILASVHFNIERIDLLKIDVQGFEMNVLKGADMALAKSKYLLVEMSLVPLFEGQEPFDAVLCYLREKGFHQIDFVEGARSKVSGELLQLDMLFST